MEINGVAFKDPTSSSGTSAAASTLADTFDTFLALLTTQLKNQDPLDPMKSAEFTSQLVQFAGVEQSINTNKRLDKLVQLQTSSQLNSAVSFIGKTVEVVSDLLLLKDGAAHGHDLQRGSREVRGSGKGNPGTPGDTRFNEGGHRQGGRLERTRYG